MAPAAVAVARAAEPRRRASDLRVIEDRRGAIAAVLAAAGPGDVVVVAGKGHETTQTLGTTVSAFDDRTVVAEELAGLGYTGPSTGGAS